MRSESALKAFASTSQQPQRTVDTARKLRELLGVERRRDWLTMPQLAQHGKFMSRDGESFSPEAARKFVTRHPELPRGYRGRLVIVDRAVYDAFVMTLERKSA